MPESLLEFVALLDASHAIAYLLMGLGAWFATVPAGWFVARLLRAKREQLTEEERGFPDGGKVIGQLERLWIYLFVLSGELNGVGFLIATKSIFRFGELSDHENRKEAEYITIGTLTSFLVGLVVALGFRELIKMYNG